LFKVIDERISYVRHAAGGSSGKLMTLRGSFCAVVLALAEAAGLFAGLLAGFGGGFFAAVFLAASAGDDASSERTAEAARKSRRFNRPSGMRRILLA
jgi:hypothetical protein